MIMAITCRTFCWSRLLFMTLCRKCLGSGWWYRFYLWLFMTPCQFLSYFAILSDPVALGFQIIYICCVFEFVDGEVFWCCDPHYSMLLFPSNTPSKSHGSYVQFSHHYWENGHTVNAPKKDQLEGKVNAPPVCNYIEYLYPCIRASCSGHLGSPMLLPKPNNK